MKQKKLFLFDIDGTIAIDTTLLPGTLSLLDYIDSINGKYIFITNNSTKSIKDYIEKFKKWNIYTTYDNFITASYATCRYLQKYYCNKKVFLLGTKSFELELKCNGLNITTEYEDDIDIVLVGFDNELTYKKIENACKILQTQDVKFLATNPDIVCPTSFGFIPDCGSICNIIVNATNQNPFYIGKPNKDIIDMCIEQTGFTKEEIIVVGDRLYTDIACGINANVDTAVVFTGEAKKEDIIHTQYIPTYSFNNVQELYNTLITKENI